MTAGAVVAAPRAAIVAARSDGRVRPSLRRRLVVFGVLLLGGAAWISVATLDRDSGQDAQRLARQIGHDAANLRWQFGAIVVAFGLLHYVATTIAARAAVGSHVPWAELFVVQLAAAAANRVTPAGSGGSAVTARYFTRREIPWSLALASVAAMTVVGAITDLLVLLVVVGLGSTLGLSGGAAEFHRLVSHLRHALGAARSPWLWLLVIGAFGLVLLAARHSGRIRRAGADMVSYLRALSRRPRSLLVLMVATGSTTLLLAFAFAASTEAIPGPHAHLRVGALVVGFMIASAAGNAVPVPAGLGSTEAALSAVLVTAGMAVAQAVQIVLLFRLITFWAPAVAGVVATRWLYRRGAL